MDTLQKFKRIIDIQRQVGKEITLIETPISQGEIEQMETILGQKLPDDFLQIYRTYNGQNPKDEPAFFGVEFLNSGKIIERLQFSQSIVKPHDRTILSPEKSNQIIQQIVDFYFSQAPKNTLFGLKKSWYCMKFQLGVNMHSSPKVYKDQNQDEATSEFIEISDADSKNILALVRELYDLEKPCYGWDELHFTIFNNKTFELKRVDWEFNSFLTSDPEGAIKTNYFNLGWLPLFSDYGGNYLGLDLDPDSRGTKGQIINFGRDEEDMLVYAESLEKFLDLILQITETKPDTLLNSEYHLFDALKEYIQTHRM
ncbi:MAG: SMI1/KNR4 family protein [Capnocytophaga sp.]|nr:SMI1/KNR4 family protein [Capnocytophaga sp.]